MPSLPLCVLSIGRVARWTSTPVAVRTETLCQSDSKTGGLAEVVSRWHQVDRVKMLHFDNVVFPAGWVVSAELIRLASALKDQDGELQT